MWVTADERKARQAVKSRLVAQKPPCAQAAAHCKQHTRYSSMCTLPGTIIISKLYNELGHSTRSSVTSSRGNRCRPNIDVDILLRRDERTRKASLSLFLTFANAQIVGLIRGFHDARLF